MRTRMLGIFVAPSTMTLLIGMALASGALSLMVGCPTTVDGIVNGTVDDGTVDDGTVDDDGDVDDDGGDDGGGSVAATYMGTDMCLTCHGAAAVTGRDMSSFLDTGHPYKLNAVVDGQPPEYPVTELAGPPEGLTFDDVSFVIGGFRYKYRVVDSEGFVVLGPSAQYNFPSRAFSKYSNDDDHTAPDGTPGPWSSNIGRKPYDCGRCHTTGYDAEAENHLGLDGLVGDWQFEGIHCEECHGPGSLHMTDTAGGHLTAEPDSATVCGKCHTRSSDGIAASGGFVKHHEQWDEFSRTAHAQAPDFAEDGCMTCHDPHQPIFDATRLAAIQALSDGDVTAVDDLPPPPGIIRQCTECHDGVTVTHPGPKDCLSCHMAYTTKTAVATGPNSGDIRSHAWLINTDAEAPAFTDADGTPVSRDDADVTFAALNEAGRPYITLDFACLRCHTDEGDDIAWAAGVAGIIHPGD